MTTTALVATPGLGWEPLQPALWVRVMQHLAQAEAGGGKPTPTVQLLCELAGCMPDGPEWAFDDGLNGEDRWPS